MKRRGERSGLDKKKRKNKLIKKDRESVKGKEGRGKRTVKKR